MSKRKAKNPASSAAKVIADICGDPSMEREIKRQLKREAAAADAGRLKVWMLKNSAGQYLCHGNLNKGLGFHFAEPVSATYLEAEHFAVCETRGDARIAADIANKNFHKYAMSRKGFMKGDPQFLKNTHVRPVQVEIAWRDI